MKTDVVESWLYLLVFFQFIQVHAISYILLITCGSPIHVDLFELKGLSADMAAAMAAGFSGPMPHALMCTMPTRPPILNVPDADPPRLNVTRIQRDSILSWPGWSCARKIVVNWSSNLASLQAVRVACSVGKPLKESNEDT